MAVDTAGNLYVADPDNKRVLKLAAGSSTPTVLPFTGLNAPQGCGGGQRRQRLRHRPAQPGAEAAGGVMRRTAGARGCRASPTEAT